MPDTNPPERKPEEASGQSSAGAVTRPQRSAFWAFFDLAFLTVVAVVGGSAYLYGFNVNDAFFNMEAILAFCFVVPLVYGIARRRKVKRIVIEVLGALFGALLVGTVYMCGCLLFVGFLYASADAAPTFADQYFAAVDKENTGFVTSNQLAAISNEQFDLRSALMDVESGERSLKSSSAIPSAQRDEMVKHYESVRQSIAAMQLPQAEMDSIRSLNGLCFAGHASADGNDCIVSRDDLHNYKAKLEKTFPQWITVMRRVGLID